MRENKVNPLYEIEDMELEILKKAKEENLENTIKALKFAKEHHEGQTRKEGLPYIIHPLMLVYSAIKQGINEDELLAVMLLHDVCEDCKVAVEELPFSDEIKAAVDSLTFNIKENETRAQAKKRYYDNLKNNRMGVITKAFDRCHNISTMGEVYSYDKMAYYIKETKDYIMPLIKDAIMKYSEYKNVLFGIEYHMKSVMYMSEACMKK